MPRASKTGVRGLYREGDRWRIDLRWVDPKTGKPGRHRERLPEGTTSAGAKRAALDLLTRALAGALNEAHTAPVTLGAALREYTATMRSSGLRTVGHRESHARELAKLLGGDARPLAEVAAFDLERAKRTLREGGRAPGTVNRYLATWRHFAGWAAKTGNASRGWAAEVRDVRGLREPAGRVRYLSADEEKILAERLDGWLRPIAFAGLYTGARLGELTSLRWRDVDLRGASLTFTKTKQGKPHVVPIAPALAEVLATLPKGEPAAFVFPIPLCEPRSKAPTRTEEQRRRDETSRGWAKFAARVGLADFRFHDTRHDAATRMRRAGAGLDVVAAVLGHSTIRITTRYAHLGREDTRAAVGSIGFAPGLPPAAQRPAARKEVSPLENRRRRSDSNRCVRDLQAPNGASEDPAESEGSALETGRSASGEGDG